MILVITGIVFLLMILGFSIDAEEVGAFFLLGIIICIIAIIALTCGVVRERTINSKIEMYQEENLIIENKVKETVKAYMNFEEKTYKELVKDADLTTLVIKYPELNSNELVKTEINLYVENNNKIKQLKEEKIDLTIKKWWLYFGK